MPDQLFPEGSFCIALSSEQVERMFAVLDERRIPFYYICDYGAVPCHCEDVSDAVVVLQWDSTEGYFIASMDYLKTSSDGVFVKLITDGNFDVEMPNFEDVFSVFEANDENLGKWKRGEPVD